MTTPPGPDALAPDLVRGYTPGLLARVTELHIEYYHSAWGLGLAFEADIARGLADFFVSYDDRRDGFWTARVDGRIEGSIAIDGSDAAGEGVRLRWFVLSERARGRGLGHALIETALGFCREKNYPYLYLLTFDGLRAARHLYEKYGFVLEKEWKEQLWGVELLEQRLGLDLTAGG